MEDAHATILDLDKTDESAEAQCGKGKKGKNSFFAVYDGHGGEQAYSFGQLDFCSPTLALDAEEGIARVWDRLLV